MKSTIKTLAAALVITLLAALWTVNPAFAQDGSGFQETFDDASLQGWEHSQDVLVSDGVLRISPGNFAFRHGDYQNITMSLKVLYTSPGEVIIHYNATDQGAYGLHILPEGFILEHGQENASSELGTAFDIQLTSGSWMNIKVSESNGQHQVYLDNELIISATDPNPLASGAVGLVVMGENEAQFDDIVLTGESAVPMGSVGEGEPPPPGEPDMEPGMEGEEPPMEEPGIEPAGQTMQTTPQTQTQPTGSELSLVQEFYASQSNQSDLLTLVINLLLAAAAAYILSRVYIHWGTSLTNRRKFAANFLLITVTTTFIILVVRSSIALSLGLVGALSIIRFRTAVKEPEELAYLFFAIAIGIGLGDNQRLITLLTLAVAVAIIGLMKLLRRTQADVNLHMTIASRNPEKLDMQQVMQALKPYCAKLKLLRFDENPNTLELSFVVEFRKLENLTQARAAIAALSDKAEITFLDNKGIW